MRCNIQEDYLKSAVLIYNILIRTETRGQRKPNFFFQRHLSIKYNHQIPVDSAINMKALTAFRTEKQHIECLLCCRHIFPAPRLAFFLLITEISNQKTSAVHCFL